MRNAHDLAASLGAKVEYVDLTHLDRDGDCNIDTRTIRLQPGMLDRLERSVLAHECAHLARGDRRSIFGFYNDRDERYADEWAAHFLIDVDSYREAEARFGSNTRAIAEELNVMEDIVEGFERTLQRIGDMTYINARMGVGQWSDRIEVA